MTRFELPSTVCDYKQTIGGPNQMMILLEQTHKLFQEGPLLSSHTAALEWVQTVIHDYFAEEDNLNASGKKRLIPFPSSWTEENLVFFMMKEFFTKPWIKRWENERSKKLFAL
jgi:hypothetical protein